MDGSPGTKASAVRPRAADRLEDRVASFRNKLLFLLLGALLLSAFAPWVVTPILMLGEDQRQAIAGLADPALDGARFDLQTTPRRSSLWRRPIHLKRTAANRNTRG